MLYDHARIFVQGGAGGDGCLSFRREAHVPRGGPDGGNGGRGGDVVLTCDPSLRDLQGFKRRAHYRAGRGRHGQGALRHGARGEELVIGVPPGTQARTQDGTLFDLLFAGQRVCVAAGGPGGRGNKQFATATRQAPRFAERGLPGREDWLELRLKLLADVGLVGLPNAGKSSLLARLTRAAPKVASYPFTTVEPVLGTLERDGRQLVVADIPGLIEGASAGAGLGHEFLAHVERTRLLVHVVDVAPMDESEPVANHAAVERELALHDERLGRLPRVLALAKADLLSPHQAEAAVGQWRGRLGPGAAVMLTSAATGQGLSELGAELMRRVKAEDEDASQPGAAVGVSAELDALAEHRVFRPAAGPGFEVHRVADGVFRVHGQRVERLAARYDLTNDEALAHVEERLRRIGVIDALAREGFVPGDEVEIAGVTFELDPGR